MGQALHAACFCFCFVDGIDSIVHFFHDDSHLWLTALRITHTPFHYFHSREDGVLTTTKMLSENPEAYVPPSVLSVLSWLRGDHVRFPWAHFYKTLPVLVGLHACTLLQHHMFIM